MCGSSVAEHPVDRRVDELVRRDVVGVPGPRRREDVGVLLEAGVRRVGDGGEASARDSAGDGDGEEEDGGGEARRTARNRRSRIGHVERPSQDASKA